MRILIVEDEAVAARSLLAMLAELAPELQPEPVLGSVTAAIERLLRAPAPDLLFMDVHLSDGLCFDVLDAVPVSIPMIFTTAYDEFALRAFEAFGIDYLLKPLRPERLQRALTKWRQLTHAGQVPAPSNAQLAQTYFQASQRYRERFLVHHGQAMVTIPVADIAYFHKDLLVRMTTRTGQQYSMAQSLDELEQVLDPARFFRANRQLLVQIDALGPLHRGYKGKLELSLLPPLAEPVLVSQERAAAFRAWLDR